MRFLVDNALSFIVSEELTKLGYDAIHVRDVGLQSAEDQIIFERAKEEDRTIIIETHRIRIRTLPIHKD